MHLIEKRSRRDELLRRHHRTQNRLPDFSPKLDTHPPTLGAEVQAEARICQARAMRRNTVINRR